MARCIVGSSSGTAQVNTSFLERLVVVFRQRIYSLTKNTSTLAHQGDDLYHVTLQQIE